jgi:hypothetical protein
MMTPEDGSPGGSAYEPRGGPAPPPPASARNIPPDAPPWLIKVIVDREYGYGNVALILGWIVVIAGAVMIIVGIAGAVDLTFDVGDTKIHLKTAVVGIVMAVIGAAIILSTRPKIIFGKKGKS